MHSKLQSTHVERNIGTGGKNGREGEGRPRKKFLSIFEREDQREERRRIRGWIGGAEGEGKFLEGEEREETFP